METSFDAWSEYEEYKNRVLFLKCDKGKCNHDIFEKYNVKTMPTIVFIRNNEQVAPPVTKFNVRVEEIMDGLLNDTK
jgi:thioredoxin-related protein